MHPPFGFALFYLRSVAPPAVRTAEIYWGAVPFLGIQVLMVVLIVAFPQVVNWGLDTTAVRATPTQVTIPDQGGGASLLDSQEYDGAFKVQDEGGKQ